MWPSTGSGATVGEVLGTGVSSVAASVRCRGRCGVVGDGASRSDAGPRSGSATARGSTWTAPHPRSTSRSDDSMKSRHPPPDRSSMFQTRSPSSTPARYISRGRPRTFATAPAGVTCQSSNDGGRSAEDTPRTTTNSIEPSSRTSGVRIASIRSPVAWNAVTRLQRRVRRSTRHRLSSPSSSVLSNPGSASPTTATTVSADVKTGENTATAPRGSRDRGGRTVRRRPDPQARAQRPDQLPVGRPRRVARLARLGQADDPVGGLDDDGVRAGFVEHVRRARARLRRHVAHDVGPSLGPRTPAGHRSRRARRASGRRPPPRDRSRARTASEPSSDTCSDAHAAARGAWPNAVPETMPMMLAVRPTASEIVR